MSRQFIANKNEEILRKFVSGLANSLPRVAIFSGMSM